MDKIEKMNKKMEKLKSENNKLKEELKKVKMNQELNDYDRAKKYEFILLEILNYVKKEIINDVIISLDILTNKQLDEAVNDIKNNKK